MDYLNQQEEVNYNNPKNRFLFCCCKSYEVDKGWGFGCCGCRLFPFSCGIFLFAVIYLISSIKDLIDIIKNNYIEDSSNKTLKIFFYIKLLGDIICIIGSIFGINSIRGKKYCSSVVAYYLVMLSLFLNTSFCIYVITVICSLSFWKAVGFYRVISVILWYGLDYFLLIYDWICFCNMVDIDRKIKEERQKNPYQFGF